MTCPKCAMLKKRKMVLPSVQTRRKAEQQDNARLQQGEQQSSSVHDVLRAYDYPSFECQCMHMAAD